MKAVRIFVEEHAMDDATCRRVQAAMDVGVREPSEVIEDEMALVEDVRRASHIEVPPAIFELIDAHLDAQRDCDRRVLRVAPRRARRRQPPSLRDGRILQASRGQGRPAGVATGGASCVHGRPVSRERSRSGPGRRFQWRCPATVPGRRGACSTSCRVAGCSSPFPPTPCTKCCRLSTVIEIRSSTGFREPLFGTA